MPRSTRGINPNQASCVLARCVPLTIVLFAGWISSRALGAATDAVAEAPVVLPAFVVKEDREQPRWRYIAHRDFEILTLASDSSSTEFARQVAITMEIAAPVIPPAVRLRPTTPAMFIFDPRDGGAFGSSGGVRALVSQGTAALGGRVGGRRTSGFGGHDQDLRIFFSVDPDDLIWRAASGIYSSLLERSHPRPAAWLRVDLVLQGRDRFLFIPDSRGSPRLVPLAELPRLLGRFEATRPVLPSIGGQWEAAHETRQRLMQWALFAEDGKYRARFWDFYLRSALDPNAGEPLFQSCLGMSYAEALERVAAFRDMLIRDAERLTGFRVEFPRSRQSVVPGRTRDATPAEIARITGESARLATHTFSLKDQTIRSRLLAVAGRIFDRGLRDSLTRDPRLLASAGINRAEMGRDAEALPLLEDAVKASVARPRAYLELARIRLGAAKAVTEAGEKLSAAQFAGVMELLQQSFAQSDQQEQYYELLVSLWESAADKPERAELARLAACARIFTHRTDLTLRSAQLHAASGYPAEARALGEALAALNKSTTPTNE